MTVMSQPQVVVPDWSLGWRLRRSLEWADVSAKEMAGELGVSEGTISRWCHDVGAPPRSVYLRAWATYCRVPFVWLQYGEDGLPPEDSVLKRGRLCDDRPSRDEILSLRKAIPMQFALIRARAT